MCLTYTDKTLLHLGRFDELGLNGYVVPFDLTQDGIALALGISRAHISIVLKRLGERSLVTWRLAHTGGSVSRRVYTLTSKGRRAEIESKKKMEEDGLTIEMLFVEKLQKGVTPLAEMEMAYRKILEAAEKMNAVKDEKQPNTTEVTELLLDAVRIIINRNMGSLMKLERSRGYQTRW